MIETTKQQSWIKKAGAILILIGALSIFPENDTLPHTMLQITFVLGCIVYFFSLKRGV